MSQYLVLAIGNVLLSDDGVGAKVLDQLQRSRSVPPDARVVDGGTLGFSLARELDDCAGLIVVDASHMSATPGTVRCFDGDAMDEQLQRSGRSVHEVGLSDLLDMARLIGQLSPHRVLIGIEPAKVEWGETLSPEVAAAVPVAAGLVVELLDSWRDTAPGVSRPDASRPAGGMVL